MPNSTLLPLYARIAALGAVCGMRSMLGPALAAQHGASRPARLFFGLLAAGELVGDKLPRTPSRLAPGPLVGRIVSGAGIGFVLSRRAGRAPWPGIALGAGAAVAGAWGGSHARKAFGPAMHVPDAVVAVAEDALAYALGRRVA